MSTQGTQALARTHPASDDASEASHLFSQCLEHANSGNLDAFDASLERFTAAAPESVEISLLQAIRQHVTGEYSAAISAFTPLIENVSARAETHYYYGLTLLQLHRVEEAIAAFKHATQRDPTFPKPFHYLSKFALGTNQASAALDFTVQGLESCPNDRMLWHILNDVLRHQPPLTQKLPQIQNILVDAFRAKIIPLDLLATPIRAALLDAPLMHTLTRYRESGILEEQLLTGDALPLCTQPLFTELMRYGKTNSVSFELFLTELRRILLTIITEKKYLDTHVDDILTLCAALCHYSFNTDYVLFESEAEKNILEPLAQDITDDMTLRSAEEAVRIALYAAYRPLANETQHDMIAKALSDSPYTALHDIRNIQIDQPLKEEAYRKQVESFSEVVDETSQNVRAHYEESPYPRWHILGEIKPKPFASLIASFMPYLTPDQLPSISPDTQEPLEILIAGAGTGRHALIAAKQYAHAQVLAIDLSATSLGYARMKAEEFGITNVTFHQGDILKLPELERRFDVVESVGVLHHMKDPMKGWEAITQCLKPGGWMQVSLYNHHNRADIRAGRESIKTQGYTHAADDIRRFRHALLSSAPELQALHGLTDYSDFYTLSECRDLLFHVQEHHFTYEEIAPMIDALGLEFIGVMMREPSYYPILTQGDAPITHWQSLEQWEVAQQLYPDLFYHMHSFWLTKPR